MPDGVQIPGGPVFIGFPQPPDVPCDPSGDGWRGPPGPAGPQGVPGMDGGALSGLVNVTEHGAAGDGVTDDTAAIQSVLNTYAGKATVFIPWTPTSYRTSKLTIPANTSLLLHGKLFALSGLVSGYIDIINVSNVSIAGYGSIDANGPSQTAVGGMAGMAVANSTNIRVSGIGITNAFHWNMNVTQSSNVVFYGVTITKGGAANEFAAGSDDCWLTNCTIDGTGLGDYAFCFYGGVTNSGASGNLVRNAGAGTSFSPPGIGILSDGTAPAANSPPCVNILIANNIVHGCGAAGISCFDVASPTGVHSGIIISNNRCYNNNQIGGTANIADIYIDSTTDISITGNQLSGNGTSAISGAIGIYIGPNASHVSIMGNQIYDVGQGQTNGAGIWIAGANYVYVGGNYIYDNQTTPTMQYAIIGAPGTHCSLIGNFFDRPYNFGAAIDTVSANVINGAWTVGALGSGDVHSAINVSVGSRGSLQYQVNGLGRWFVGTDGTAEPGAGSNGGSNYVVSAVNDAGNALIGLPALTINRATGKVTLAVAPTITTLPANAANDAAAASAGVAIGGMYRSGSTLMIRVA